MVKTCEELHIENMKNRSMVDKLSEMVELMEQWIINLQQNKEIAYFFERNGYQKIAIYGTSYLSRRLQQELQNTDITIELIFDKSTMEEIKSHNVDVIVVTSLYYFYEIILELEKITDCRVVSIGEIVYLT